MHDIVLVEIVHRLEDLLDGLGCILFSESALLANAIEEFAASRKFRDDVELFL